MNRWWTITLGAVLALASPVYAQFPLGGYNPPQMQSRPPVSPYLNLNRGGTQPGINYYGLVRPQQQTAQQLQNLQGQQNALAGELNLGGGMVAPGQPVPTSVTGHPVYYMDYNRFFPPQGLPPGGAGFGPGGYGGGLGAAPGSFGAAPGILGGRGPGNVGFGIVVR